MDVLGIDIGGSGIKGAIVDTQTGALVTERERLETPEGATPQAVAATVAELVRHFDWHGPVGCGFPAAIQHGVARTAANIHKSFIGTHVPRLFEEQCGSPCYVVNDADAAGTAEMAFGAGKGQKGVVMLITIGTGLGTALFTDGVLLPNTELGHIILPNGQEAERFASDAVRKKEDLKWKPWANRFNDYLMQMEALFWPDTIILGGGSSKKLDKFSEFLTVRAKVVPAAALNQAGIIGAALYGASRHEERDFTKLTA